MRKKSKPKTFINSFGLIFIKLTANNLIITITDLDGNVIL
jgi:ribosomal protein S11